MTETNPMMRESGSPHIAVVGSVNLDLVATAPRLPTAGETITDAKLMKYPGGKGANQALAARRLGARVSLCAHVGDDDAANEALAILREETVDLSCCSVDPVQATGIALIVVAPAGENQIVVAPGANRTLTPDALVLPEADALICQLEVPVETVAYAAEKFEGFFCINLAPARPVASSAIQRADLLVMNETEAEIMRDAVKDFTGITATTFGASGARLVRQDAVLAESRPPSIDAVDSTGAGDVFTAALTVKLVSGSDPQAALDFACAAGAAAACKPGAQPSFPHEDDVLSLLAKR